MRYIASEAEMWAQILPLLDLGWPSKIHNVAQTYLDLIIFLPQIQAPEMSVSDFCFCLIFLQSCRLNLEFMHATQVLHHWAITTFLSGNFLGSHLFIYRWEMMILSPEGHREDWACWQ